MAVETFVKNPKQERRVNRLYYGGAGVPGNGGAAKKTEARAGMTLSLAVAAFHGVVGVFAYCTIAKRMDVGSVSEPHLGHAVTSIGQAVGRHTAARERQCDRGHYYADSIERDQGHLTIKAQFGNKPAQHAVFTSGSDSDFEEAFRQLKTPNEAKQGFRCVRCSIHV